MADVTTGTGADSMEDLRDEPALESVGADPDAPIAQSAANEPGQTEDEEEDFEDEDEGDEEDEDDDEESEQQASDQEDTE